MAQKSIISSVERRVSQLMQEHQRLSQLTRVLTAQRDELQQEKRQLQERVKELEHQLDIKYIGEGLASSKQDKVLARARVNRLMREVDKCINLLTSLKGLQ
ncbi:MAG: hypothetical protein SNH13_01550 [Rikenellaceae bacterium]